MQTIRIIIIALLLPMVTLAQKVSVSGKVTSADTKATIPGASVYLSNSSVGTSTGNDGGFSLNGLNPGQYMLVVSAVGYESSTQTILINNQEVKLDVSLSPKIIALNEVRITPMSKSDRRKRLPVLKQNLLVPGHMLPIVKLSIRMCLAFRF
ncbi:carboxypeptidase-like regulatory domain-containing protein [Mucilaginibacter antarcticus]|uniref:carboxypeptidase-like regulatory domain-containing protein n=1 Tax=Mucilaginibacter antarcticus TaxID=1855725 RepID=UPI003630C291